MEEIKMRQVRVPILIVGGGGCGLAASNMLSNLNVEHVLVEAHAGTSILPKAHILNQRTAEILHQHNLWEKIWPFGTPREHASHFHFKTTFGGDGPFDRITLGKVSCFGWNDNPGADEEQEYILYDRYSQWRGTNLPQIRLEPILRTEAELRNPNRVLFNHSAVGFKEHEDHVAVDILNRATGEKVQYLADYVIAADGGKTFGPALGVQLEGPKAVADVTTVHFKADLSKYWEKGTLMYWLIDLGDQDPTLGPSPIFGAEWNVLVPMGPSWGPNCEEFGLHLNLSQLHPPVESLTDDELKRRIRNVLKIPELEVEVLKASLWHLQGVTATKYQTQRIFLAGDAVHRHPPNTGLGLNTAIGDAQNITWKLAAVLKGQAQPSILQTYESERLPVGKRNTQWAMFTFMNLRLIDTAMGLLPGGISMRPHNEQVFQQLLADTGDGAARRAAVNYAVQSQRVELAAQDLDLGGVYPKGAFVADGTPRLPVDPRGIRYTPTARPGHRLPHAWLEGPIRVSTHHLVENKGDWALITDDSEWGATWVSKAAELSEKLGLKINAARVGPDGDFREEDGQWTKDSGLEPSKGGVVLVRPDNYVAFRAPKYSDEAISRLEEVFQ